MYGSMALAAPNTGYLSVDTKGRKREEIKRYTVNYEIKVLSCQILTNSVMTVTIDG